MDPTVTTGLVLGAAGGMWTPDLAEARRQADRTLAQLDLSRPGPIVLWVPGTSSHAVPAAFAQAVDGLRALGSAQVGLVDYPATWHMRSSVTTGYVALELVLDEIRRRRGANAQVLLAGESQGAWIIGELLTDPRYARLVRRATLLGHPAPARTHYPALGSAEADSSRAVEINNRADHVPDTPHASPVTVLNAMEYIGTGNIVGGLPWLLRIAMSDPGYLLQAGFNALRGTALSMFGDPHDYASRMQEAAALLAASASAPVTPARSPRRGATG
jgi:hypothetical protein